MAFRFYERAKSRKSSSKPPSVQYKYVATGETSAATVKAYAMAATASVIVAFEGFLYRGNVSVEQAGYDTYYVDVEYGERKLESGSYTIDFDTTGGTVHISASKQTIASYGTSPPSHKQLIGVNGENVDGCDIVIPALKLNVKFKHPQAVITLAQIKALAGWTGMVNSTSFLTFAAGEVLFLGATGSEGTDTETEVAYQFACSQNATGLTIGDIASVAKKGHEYLWIAYKDAVDSSKPVKQPEYVYIERVYDTVDLAAALGFGA